MKFCVKMKHQSTVYILFDLTFKCLHHFITCKRKSHFSFLSAAFVLQHIQTTLGSRRPITCSFFLKTFASAGSVFILRNVLLRCKIIMTTTIKKEVWITNLCPVVM